MLENVPGAHMEQVDARAPEKDPAGHELHTELPLFAYVPVVQVVQVVLAGVERVPIGQSLQLVNPVFE
jgi:hypothetical protein